MTILLFFPQISVQLFGSFTLCSPCERMLGSNVNGKKKSEGSVFDSFFLVFAEGAPYQERLPTHVCLQAGHCQIQVVGPAKQSGELHSEGLLTDSNSLLITVVSVSSQMKEATRRLTANKMFAGVLVLLPSLDVPSVVSLCVGYLFNPVLCFPQTKHQHLLPLHLSSLRSKRSACSPTSTVSYSAGSTNGST